MSPLRALAAGTLSTWAFLALASAPTAGAVLAPPGFVVENAAPDSYFLIPTQVVFLPDGRKLVADVHGRVWVLLADGTQLPDPFIDIELEVMSRQDLGLLGLAIDPDFETNRWVYFSYTVDPNMDGFEGDPDGYARLTRYQASETDPNVADLSTRQVLIGTVWGNAIPTLHQSHSVGAIRFAADKTLLLAAGDGGHHEVADSGGLDPDAFGPGKFSPSLDMGAFRARSLNAMSGCILRVDKDTGQGLDSNPFWDGDPFNYRSRIWLYGLRNPYRFCVRPGTGSADPAAGDPGVLYIGDVGWMRWEELDIARTGGINFGWPCYEGASRQGDYYAITETAAGNDSILCTSPLNLENPVLPTAPDLWWHHTNPDLSQPPGWTGSTSIGGVFYTGDSYPEEYRGRYFLADFVQSWIRMIEVDVNDNVVGWSEFLSDADGPVDIEVDPATGDLYYVSIFTTDQIHHVRYVGPTSVGAGETPAGDDAPHATLPFVEIHPNPVRRTPLVRFGLPEPGPASLRVYGARGRLVRTLLDDEREAGVHSLWWDGRDEEGRRLPSGVYYFQLRTNGRVVSERMVKID